MKRPGTRYLVRNTRGDELIVPSLTDLSALYTHGFLSDDDLVRQERAEQWIRAGDFEALTGVRRLAREGSPAQVALIVGALAALAIGLGILLAR